MGVVHLETAFNRADGAKAPETVCSRCGVPGVVGKTVSMAFWRGSGLYVIRGIPVMACAACHGEHLAEETVMALDRMRNSGLTSDHMDEAMIVPVYRFAPPKEC